MHLDQRPPKDLKMKASSWARLSSTSQHACLQQQITDLHMTTLRGPHQGSPAPESCLPGRSPGRKQGFCLAERVANKVSCFEIISGTIDSDKLPLQNHFIQVTTRMCPDCAAPSKALWPLMRCSRSALQRKAKVTKLAWPICADTVKQRPKSRLRSPRHRDSIDPLGGTRPIAAKADRARMLWDGPFRTSVKSGAEKSVAVSLQTEVEDIQATNLWCACFKVFLQVYSGQCTQRARISIHCTTYYVPFICSSLSFIASFSALDNRFSQRLPKRWSERKGILRRETEKRSSWCWDMANMRRGQSIVYFQLAAGGTQLLGALFYVWIHGKTSLNENTDHPSKRPQRVKQSNLPAHLLGKESDEPHCKVSEPLTWSAHFTWFIWTSACEIPKDLHAKYFKELHLNE